MKNYCFENENFYLDLKDVHKYGSAKFQPNMLFSSQEMPTKIAAEEKKGGGRRKKGGKKVGKRIGDQIEGRDASSS